MPSINIDFLQKLKDNYINYNTFIETGTNGGDTIIGIEPFFNKLYTIEINEELYNFSKNRYDISLR
jgi:hypothetical protein